MSYLLDTNFLIGVLQGFQPYWKYLNRILEQTYPSISVITRAEIYAGCHPSEEAETRRLLDCFAPISVDSLIADIAGQYVYQFSRKGVTIYLEDAVIGATAVSRGLILVTHNVGHFPMLTLRKNLVRFPG